MKEEFDDIAKTELLKAETALGSITLSSSSSIDIQPNGTPLGLRLIDRQGRLTPMALFDTKKLREASQFQGASKAVDEALESFEEESP
jgi:hypothetical protein